MLTSPVLPNTSWNDLIFTSKLLETDDNWWCASSVDEGDELIQLLKHRAKPLCWHGYTSEWTYKGVILTFPRLKGETECNKETYLPDITVDAGGKFRRLQNVIALGNQARVKWNFIKEVITWTPGPDWRDLIGVSQITWMVAMFWTIWCSLNFHQ